MRMQTERRIRYTMQSNQSSADICRQAMLDLVSGATCADAGEPQLDVFCGYAVKQDEDTYAMSAIQGRNMDLDNVGGMLGDFLRMYAESNNLSLDEMKGLLLQVIAERDGVLPRPAVAPESEAQ